MTPEQTIITVSGSVIVALIAAGGVILGHLWGRVHHLEDQVRRAREQNRGLWAYCRRLLDLYYRHRTPGSPDPEPLPDVD